MSKTRTTIVNADILNSKINTENYNNVYPIDSPIFNKLGSIPNSLGKLTSYNSSKAGDATFIKLNDTGYIKYKNNTLEDEKGNKIYLTDPVQINDTILPSKYIDITEHYHIESNGLYKNNGTKVANAVYDKTWSLYEISNIVIVIKNSSVSAVATVCHIYKYENGTFNRNVNNINAVFTEDWAYDDDDHIYNIAKDQVIYWINVLGYVGSQDLKNISSTYPLQKFCYGMVEVQALPKFYHKTVGKRMQLEALPEYNATVVNVSNDIRRQTLMKHIDLKFKTNGFVIESTGDHKEYSTYLTSSDTPDYSITSQSDGPKCFKVGFNLQSSGREYYIQAAPTNKHFRRMFDSPDNRTSFTGIQSEKDANEDLFYYYKYGRWKIYTFDGKNAATYDDYLVVPFGFIDNICEIRKNGLIIYVNSLDQQVHCLKVEQATSKYIFDNAIDISVNSFNNKMIIEPFEENLLYYQTSFIFTSNNPNVVATPLNDKIETPIVAGNNINYMKINNTLTLSTDGKYYLSSYSLYYFPQQ